MSAPVALGRRTRIRFDVDDPVAVEPLWGMTRSASEVVARQKDAQDKVFFTRGLGWHLLPISADPHRAFETTDYTPYLLLASNGTLEIPEGFVEFNAFRKPSDQTNADAGAAANVPETGAIFIGKRVTAGTAWDDERYRLAADQTGFPGPNLDADSFVMDRVAKSTLPHEPGQAVHCVLSVPAGRGQANDKTGKLYFCAPPSSNDSCRGVGRYCLVSFKRGYKTLWEYGKLGPSFTASGWTRRHSFKTSDFGGAEGLQYIKVYPAPKPGPGKSGRIVFNFSEVSEDTVGGLVGSVVEALQNASPLYVYDCLNDGKGGAPELVPVRLDTRRPGRASFQLGLGGYEYEGTLIDDPVVLPFFPQNEDELFSVEVYGYFPLGCSVTIELQDGDAKDDSGNHTYPVIAVAEAGQYGSTTTTTGFWADFPIQLRTRTYRAKYTLTGTGFQTPILAEFRYIKDGVTTIVSPGEMAIRTDNAEISIMGAESDATQESASVHFEDVFAEADTLATRAGQSAVIETNYDPEDNTKWCVLFRGYVDEAPSNLKGTPGRSFPDPEWASYEVKLDGVWRRFREAFAPYGWNWNVDPNAMETVGSSIGIGPGGGGYYNPYKVTDVLKFALQWAGFTEDLESPDDSQIAIPDLPMRMFPVSSDDSMRIEIFADIAELVQRIARDYLGQALLFDHNLGNYGKWILVNPPRAPYTNLAYFTTSGPAAGRLVHCLESYPPTHIAASETTVEVTVPTAYIVKGTYRPRMKPPEFNKLTVTGIGDFGTSSAHKLTQTYHNYKSYNPNLGVVTATPENNPDYIGRCVEATYMDPCLNTKAAVNWVLRRLVQIGAHGYRLLPFQAPLVIIQHPTDPSRVRHLRFGDPVQVNGTQYIVRNVNPDYQKDAVQMATYELQQPRF